MREIIIWFWYLERLVDAIIIYKDVKTLRNVKKFRSSGRSALFSIIFWLKKKLIFLAFFLTLDTYILPKDEPIAFQFYDTLIYVKFFLIILPIITQWYFTLIYCWYIFIFTNKLIVSTKASIWMNDQFICVRLCAQPLPDAAKCRVVFNFNSSLPFWSGIYTKKWWINLQSFIDEYTLEFAPCPQCRLTHSFVSFRRAFWLREEYTHHHIQFPEPMQSTRITWLYHMRVITNRRAFHWIYIRAALCLPVK